MPDAAGVEAVAGVAAGYPFESLLGGEVGFCIENSVDDLLIFLWFERAGGIDKKPRRRQKLKSVQEDSLLLFGEILNIFGPETPFDVGVAGQGSGTGAGGIDQDAVERRAERQGGGSVEGDGIDGHCRQVVQGRKPVQVKVGGDRS